MQSSQMRSAAAPFVTPPQPPSRAPHLSCTQGAKDFMEGLSERAEKNQRREEQAMEDADFDADFEMGPGFSRGRGRGRVRGRGRGRGRLSLKNKARRSNCPCFRRSRAPPPAARRLPGARCRPRA